MKAVDMKTACGGILLVALLAGCGAIAPERKPDQKVNLGGYSPSFKQGYSDGCESAGSRGQRRDEKRFKTEADYMMGWNDGFSVCRRGP
jgi:hypothetical protein